MTKGVVCKGDEFAVSTVTVEESEIIKTVSNVGIAERDAKVRQVLALAFVIILGVALFIAALTGFQDGSFDGVFRVWSAGALPMGFILRGYFGKG